ncbi:MAG TPA: DUF3445 domain-containing protein [Arenibaculum sp.]|nr:DUF3445 domain-containing protein [Arenibaculum sp.]
MTPGTTPDYLPFEDGPFRMAMGLQSLAVADWIEIDGHYAADMALRRRLLADRHADVHVVRDEALPAAREVLERLAGFLPMRFPRHFGIEGGRLVNRVTGEAWNPADPGPPPLEVAGRLVQEDLCLLVENEGVPVLAGGLLCFPNRWRLAAKVGLPLAAVHGPVALYADRLARPVDRFITHLKPERPVWRLNWSLHDDPAPFQPEAAASADGTAPVTPLDAGGRLFLRVERQTLSRLPRTGAVLFTIRTYIRPLGDLAGRPADAARFAATLRGLPDEVARYKGLASFRNAAVEWLDRMAGAEAPA